MVCRYILAQPAALPLVPGVLGPARSSAARHWDRGARRDDRGELLGSRRIGGIGIDRDVCTHCSELQGKLQGVHRRSAIRPVPGTPTKKSLAAGRGSLHFELTP
jgi:hypothetical protein